MASDDRERNFDKALTRHLRSVAPAQPAAQAAAQPAPLSACPDSETLAAYHERSLLPEEMNAWKEHIVGCKNCQTVLAHLEETDAIPLLAAEEEPFAEKELVSVAAAQSLPAVTAAASAANIVEASAAKAIHPRSIRRPKLVRPNAWRWLAPAGAIAASLLVWFAMRENRSLVRPAAHETQIAKNIPQAAPAPAQPTLVAPEISGAAPKVQPASKGAASAYSRTESHGMEKKQAQGAAPPVTAAESTTADRVSGVRKDEDRETKNALRSTELPRGVVGGVAGQRDLDAKAAPGKLAETVTVQAQASEKAAAPSPTQSQTQAQLDNLSANNQIQLQNQTNANANMQQRVPGPAPLGQATTDTQRARAATAGAPSHTASAAPAPPSNARGAMSYQGSAKMALTAASSQRLIPAPGSSVVWRPGPGGLMEISNDKGASWSRQTSGVLNDLLAGSAVSDKVCWIVGRAGTVLLTVDGGEHWKVLSSPVSEDLGGIQATDALHATVWNLGRTKSFATVDGGMTWQPVPAP